MINIYRGLCIAVAFCMIHSCVYAQKKKDHTPMVNPFIGTAGAGNTFPGAVLPYGMARVSPETSLKLSDYNYSDSTFYGFTNIRYNSPTQGSTGEILLIPTTGEPEDDVTFKKKNERSSTGYYTIELSNGIEAEVTATTRAALHKYDFPTANKANIIFDLFYGIEPADASIEVVNNREIKGYRLSKDASGERLVYFYAKFSKPFQSHDLLLNNSLHVNQTKGKGKNVKMVVQFADPGTVIVKIGLSHVSTDGALKNLDAEIADFDFKKTQKAAKTAWMNALARIDVEGGAPAKTVQPMQSQSIYTPYGAPARRGPEMPDFLAMKHTVFYTALYHTMLIPAIGSDVDGQYRNGAQTQTADGFTYYDVSNGANSYGARYQLLTLTDKKRATDVMKSYLATTPANGSFAFAALFADAYAKGIKDIDAEKAYEYIRSSADNSAAAAFNTNGYFPVSEPHAVSKTLAYTYHNWCVAQAAKLLNKTTDYAIHIQRAQYWKNLFNNSNGFIQARVNGGWQQFKASDSSANYINGNGWQYAFFVPYDAETLAAAMGGKEEFETRLDEFFNPAQQSKLSTTLGQFSPGYKFNYFMPFLYAFGNSPQKTQLTISRIATMYRAEPQGLGGDDSDGQVSAWYVLNSLGLYNVVPGKPTYHIGLPLYDRTDINFDDDKKFSVLNAGASMGRNIYLQGINLNKSGSSKLYVDYDDIAKGGELEVFTGTLPNKLFMQDLEKPSSKISDELIVAKPYITLTQKDSKQPATIEIKNIDDTAKIYYTIDGSAPTASSILYTRPFNLSTKATVKAIAVVNNKQSLTEEATFVLNK